MNENAHVFFQADNWRDDILKNGEVEIAWKTGRYPNDEIFTKLSLETGQKWEKITVWALFSNTDRLETQIFKLVLLLESISRYAGQVRLVMPYFPFSLQDREVYPGDDVGSDALAKMLEVWADEVVVVDVHSPANLQHWSIPVEHIRPERLLADAIQAEFGEASQDFAIVAPDKGATERANFYGEFLHAPVFVLEKQRLGPGKVKMSAKSLENCPAKHLLLVDDMVNTGGTLVTAIQGIHETCQAKVSVVATHGLLVGDALERLQKAGVEKIFITDSFVSGQHSEKLRVVGLLPLLQA